MHLGLGFFTPENPRAGVPRHLWFALSDPGRSDRVVLANVSTKRCTSGEVCVVAPKEHERVSAESYLRFDEVRVSPRADLDRLFESGTLQATTDASPELLRKLQRAILESIAVPLEAKDLLRNQGLPGA